MPKPEKRSGDTGQRISCFDNMNVQSVQLSGCTLKHLFPRGADRRAGGVRSRDYQLFSDG